MSCTIAAITAKQLRIGGITPYSNRDFPGRPALVVYVQGCPWRCGYCQNPHLQPTSATSPLGWDRVLNLLDQQGPRLRGVVFSGGEPTQDPALADAIAQIKARKLKVALHTAAPNAAVIKDLLPQLDWIALDIKTAFSRYDTLTGIKGSGVEVKTSAQAILDSGIAHEFRTTVHPSLHSHATLTALAVELRELGANNFIMQAFRPQGCRDSTFTGADMNGFPSPALLEELSASFPQFEYRT